MDYFDLLRRHQGYLERVALAMLGNRADAEDALQEAALAGYLNFGQLRGGEQAFGAWLRRILIRQCGRILAARPQVPLQDLEGCAAAAAPGPDPESTALWQMVARLNDLYRPIVVMRYLLDMSQQEIAAALSVPLGTVKSRLAKALELLRQMEVEEGAEAQ